MSEVLTALASDEHATGWDHETGAPGITLFSNALQVWAVLQRRRVTVEEAALTFSASPEVIRQAVNAHYWMFLDGDRIEHEGE